MRCKQILAEVKKRGDKKAKNFKLVGVVLIFQKNKYKFEYIRYIFYSINDKIFKFFLRVYSSCATLRFLLFLNKKKNSGQEDTYSTN
jgi:hypothetical protein